MNTSRKLVRCPWPQDDPLMLRYHDREWGVPVHRDRKHFEFLVLDGFQAGLSWAIVLHKREGFRRAFAGFDPARVAKVIDESLDVRSFILEHEDKSPLESLPG